MYFLSFGYHFCEWETLPLSLETEEEPCVKKDNHSGKRGPKADSVAALNYLLNLLPASLCSSAAQTPALAIWGPSQDVTHVSRSPARAAPEPGSLGLCGEHPHAQTQVLLLLRQSGTPGSTGGTVATSQGYFSAVHPCPSGAQGKALPGGGEAFHMSCLLRPTEERGLWSARDDSAPNCLPFKWICQTVGRHSSKGHQQRAAKEGGSGPYSFIMSPHHLICLPSRPAVIAPPHPGSICMQILPHLFLLPSERTNLV